MSDLLDASRVVRGQVTLQSRELDALEVLRDAVEVVQPRANERQQQVLVQLPERTVMVDADPVRLQQVFLNVLANATAYTSPHGAETRALFHATARTIRRGLPLNGREIGRRILACVVYALTFERHDKGGDSVRDRESPAERHQAAAERRMNVVDTTRLKLRQIDSVNTFRAAVCVPRLRLVKNPAERWTL